MESFTWCSNGNSCSNSAASKWVPTLFCAAVAAANYFALTLHYCTIAAATHCEHFQLQRNEKHTKVTAVAAPCERTLNLNSNRFLNISFSSYTKMLTFSAFCLSKKNPRQLSCGKVMFSLLSVSQSVCPFIGDTHVTTT